MSELNEHDYKSVLLRLYMQLDERTAPLCVLVKHWSKARLVLFGWVGDLVGVVIWCGLVGLMLFS